MRRISISVCVWLLLIFLIFSACSKVVPNHGSVNSSEPIISNDMNESVLKSDETIAPPPIDSGNTLTSIISNGETTVPFLQLLWDRSWTGDGWLSADGMSLIYMLPEIAEQFPIVTYDDDFTVQFKEGVSFTYMSIYDDGFERLYHNVDLSYLEGLPEGVYYIEIVVENQGKYIKSENQYEYHGYDCAFKLAIYQ